MLAEGQAREMEVCEVKREVSSQKREERCDAGRSHACGGLSHVLGSPQVFEPQAPFHLPVVSFPTKLTGLDLFVPKLPT